MREDQIIYVVTAGYYEENCNVLLTDSLDKAIIKLLNVRGGASIQIWKNEEEIHEYGTYTYENMKDYEKIYSDIRFIKKNGLNDYLEKVRQN
ncbi:hypothetical protein [Metabacillus sp. Hm71]|uniref:hypothetical protein n=1 Tax=Metabacillus sp. Hm71 TaxID=3450743 RepID=UPI003F431581